MEKSENHNEGEVVQHVVCVPYPAQGHVKPMQILATLLHKRHNFWVSFVNTEHNHRRLVRSHGLDALSRRTSFRFFSIPDGLPPATNPDATQDIVSLSTSLQKTGVAAFLDLLSHINNNNNNNNNNPKVTCVVVDSGCDFAYEVAKQLGLPVVVFYAASACSLLGLAQFPRLVSTGIVPIPGESDLRNEYLERVLEGIPSMDEIALKDLPSFVRAKDKNDFMLNQMLRRVDFLSKLDCPIIMNTFTSLEGESIRALGETSPIKDSIISIGPLSLLLQQDESLDDVCTSLLKEDTGCLPWLDEKSTHTVIYVNFGSITVLTLEQMAEFAYGLANSGYPFLWVVRPDLVKGESKIVDQIVDGIKGKVVPWCDQEKVLAHPAIGVFLTHCGWNSTMEALSYGVPLICWPFFADQTTNTFFVCRKWGVGVEISARPELITRDELVSVIDVAMQGEKADEMRRNATKWRTLALEATKLRPHSLQDLVNALTITSLVVN